MVITEKEPGYVNQGFPGKTSSLRYPGILTPYEETWNGQLDNRLPRVLLMLKPGFFRPLNPCRKNHVLDHKRN